MMTKDEILESGLLEQYVLGLTNIEETEMVFKAIDNYPELKDHLNKIEQTMEAIAHQHSIVPPEDLREKTFKKISESEKLKFRSAKTRTISEVLGAVFGLLLLGCVYFLYQAHNDGKIALDKKNQELNTLKTECENNIQQLEYKTNLVALYEDENFRSYNLSKTGQDKKESLVVFWGEDKGKAYLYSQSLNAPPPGMTYQIWADVDQVMLPLGIFSDNNKLIEIKCLKNATSLNVTVEPQGGSEHPDVSRLVLSTKV